MAFADWSLNQAFLLGNTLLGFHTLVYEAEETKESQPSPQKPFGEGPPTLAVTAQGSGRRYYKTDVGGMVVSRGLRLPLGSRVAVSAN